MNSRKEWEQEAVYCEAMVQNKHYDDFNTDPERFYRYCSMQSRQAAWLGFQDLADRIQDAGSAAL